MRRNHGTTKKRLIIAVAFLLAMIACTVAFAEGEEAGSNLYGTFWSLLPPIIAIGLASYYKRGLHVAVRWHCGRLCAAKHHTKRIQPGTQRYRNF